ncbi:MAG: chemotaxis protein CheB, partial [Sulfurimonas sp.]|nr:chemotaxis protein CheB [Sulfurimonas sp.]
IYIIAQHHSLAQKSVLASILGRKSTIPALTINTTTLLKPDILYILPPHLQLVSHYGKLKIMPIKEPIVPPLALIDDLFYTLTQIKQAKCIAILLSVTGHDGTAGMVQVKENNGITLAQSPEEAHFDSMLKSAIDTGVVDYILPIYEITQKLIQLSSSLRDGSYVMEETAFERIRKIVQQHKQIDFYKYKDDTIQRRIQKRMIHLKFDTLEEYATYLGANQQEVSNLEKEVLIGVTSFFRDSEAFEALKLKLHEKIVTLPQMSEFRIWCVACSTGEEAYSLAIIVIEICEELQKNIQLKIFASDIDDRALSRARVGEYSKVALKQVNPQIIKKYFIHTHTDNYQIIKELRSKIVFTHHNFLQDPPFINIDLVSCRNVLIYLLSSSQHEVFHFFHYALKKNALLFLGSSESTLASIDHFITLDQYFSIYEKEGKSTLPRLPKRLFQQDSKMPPFVGDKHMVPIDPTQIENYLHDEIFNYFAPSCIVVDQNYDIVYKKGVIPYLHFSDGIVNLNLLKNLNTDLQYEATLLLNHVVVSNIAQSSKFIEIGSENTGKFVRMIAQPLNLPATSKMIFLYFQDFSVQELRLNGTIHPLWGRSYFIYTLITAGRSTRGSAKSLR